MDLGDFGDLIKRRGYLQQWQDHGLGLLRTILHQAGIETDVASTRAVKTFKELEKHLVGYDTLIMNGRSYTFPMARRAAAHTQVAGGHALLDGLRLDAHLAHRLPHVRAHRRVELVALRRQVLEGRADAADDGDQAGGELLEGPALVADRRGYRPAGARGPQSSRWVGWDGLGRGHEERGA